jgi:hypothetical protein
MEFNVPCVVLSGVADISFQFVGRPVFFWRDACMSLACLNFIS